MINKIRTVIAPNRLDGGSANALNSIVWGSLSARLRTDDKCKPK